MKRGATIEEIEEFQKIYRNDPRNAIAEKKIKNLGLKKASIDESRRNSFVYEFNVEVPDCKVYDQFRSRQCNIYAFLRVVKDIARKRLGENRFDLDISANYINFFDKYEKANFVYEKLLRLDDITTESIDDIVNRYIKSFGTFHFCRQIVEKYGMAPASEMTDAGNDYDDALTIELLQDKIKCDAIDLIGVGGSAERREKKQQLMYEVYEFLSRVYGNPPTKFLFKGKYTTPKSFADHLLGNDLEDFITVTSFKKEEFFNSYSFIPSLYLNGNEKILYRPIDDIKKAILKQLEDGISVWFSCEESTTSDYEESILDDELFDYTSLLNIPSISKGMKLKLNVINYDHAMCITGALTQKGNIKQFKVDNSFGTYGKYQGRMIMSPEYLENCIITLILHKKYIE